MARESGFPARDSRTAYIKCGHSQLSPALFKAQQIVRLLSIGFRFYVFVSIPTYGNDNPYALTSVFDVKPIDALLDFTHGLLLGFAPRSQNSLSATDAENALMWVLSVRFINTSNLEISHGVAPIWCAR
jgi:hypothetical protein